MNNETKAKSFLEKNSFIHHLSLVIICHGFIQIPFVLKYDILWWHLIISIECYHQHTHDIELNRRFFFLSRIQFFIIFTIYLKSWIDNHNEYILTNFIHKSLNNKYKKNKWIRKSIDFYCFICIYKVFNN